MTRAWWLALLLVALAGAAWLWPRDAAWSAGCRPPRGTVAGQVARQLSFWGDWYTGWLVLGAGVLVVPRRRWRLAGTACLLAGLVAGLTADVIKVTTGRPRPSTGEVDQFCGLSLDRSRQSFPSGHTAAAFGAATGLMVLLPGLGGPALVVAGAVGWARVAVGAHYLTDVWVGAWLGVAVGVVFGLAARRRLGIMPAQ